MSSTGTSDVVVPARRRLALAAGVSGLSASILLVAAVLVPQDAGWTLRTFGWAAVLGGPFVAAQCLRSFVPVRLRGRWSFTVAASGWVALALVWSVSRIPALLTGSGAFLLVAALVGGPFAGAWVATRPSRPGP